MIFFVGTVVGRGDGSGTADGGSCELELDGTLNGCSGGGGGRSRGGGERSDIGRGERST